jgi:hypothetical protein
MPKEERDRWVAKIKPYMDERLAAFGELGKATKKIADEVNTGRSRVVAFSKNRAFRAGHRDVRTKCLLDCSGC